MPYNPLDSALLTSTLLKEGPDVVAVWMLILASADKLGISEMQPAAAASLLRIDDDRAEEAFRCLTSPDPRSRNKAHAGRRILPRDDGRWYVVSHGKYQQRASRANASRRQAAYEARLRERIRVEETCQSPGCENPAAAAIDGEWRCSEHAFSGQEG